MSEPSCNYLLPGQHPILSFDQLLHSLLVRAVVIDRP